MNKPTLLLKNTLTKKELAVVQQLRKVAPEVRDDFEKMRISFIDEQERQAEFCAYHESLLDGQRYILDCAYLRDYEEVSSLSSVS